MKPLPIVIDPAVCQDKPRFVFGRGYWHCCYLGRAGSGLTPAAAFRAWMDMHYRTFWRQFADDLGRADLLVSPRGAAAPSPSAWAPPSSATRAQRPLGGCFLR